MSETKTIQWLGHTTPTLNNLQQDLIKLEALQIEKNREWNKEKRKKETEEKTKTQEKRLSAEWTKPDTWLMPPKWIKRAIKKKKEQIQSKKSGEKINFSIDRPLGDIEKNYNIYFDEPLPPTLAPQPLAPQPLAPQLASTPFDVSKKSQHLARNPGHREILSGYENIIPAGPGARIRKPNLRPPIQKMAPPTTKSLQEFSSNLHRDHSGRDTDQAALTAKAMRDPLSAANKKKLGNESGLSREIDGKKKWQSFRKTYKDFIRKGKWPHPEKVPRNRGTERHLKETYEIPGNIHRAAAKAGEYGWQSSDPRQTLTTGPLSSVPEETKSLGGYRKKTRRKHVRKARKKTRRKAHKKTRRKAHKKARKKAHKKARKKTRRKARRKTRK